MLAKVRREECVELHVASGQLDRRLQKRFDGTRKKFFRSGQSVRAHNRVTALQPFRFFLCELDPFAD